MSRNRPPKPLSPHKSTYLQEQQFLSRQLSVVALRELIPHYNTKHKIRIIINGATEYGQQQEKIIRDTHTQLKQNSPLPLHSTPVQRNDDLSLGASEAVEEMQRIQRELKPNDIVGYFFTGGKATGSGHMEVFIIMPNAIIKPLSWGLMGPDSVRYFERSISATQLSGLFDTFTNYTRDNNYVIALQGDPTRAKLIPQASGDECAALGLMYLKELLKQDAAQLRELTLRFEYQDDKQRWQHFFFPSPQVLRYSQSGTYNDFLENMLLDSVQEQTLHDSSGQPIRFKTLKKILSDSVVAAQAEGKTELAMRNQALLDYLPDFRKKWMAIYRDVKDYRATMVADKNRYLTYAAERLNQRFMRDNLQLSSIQFVLSALTILIENNKQVLTYLLGRAELGAGTANLFGLNAADTINACKIANDKYTANLDELMLSAGKEEVDFLVLYRRCIHLLLQVVKTRQAFIHEASLLKFSVEWGDLSEQSLELVKTLEKKLVQTMKDEAKRPAVLEQFKQDLSESITKMESIFNPKEPNLAELRRVQLKIATIKSPSADGAPLELPPLPSMEDFSEKLKQFFLLGSSSDSDSDSDSDDDDAEPKPEADPKKPGPDL